MPHRWSRGRVFGAATWVALALLGLVVAAAVSLAASRLSSQHIGLSSEPLSASRQLSPAGDSGARHSAPPRKQTQHRHHRRHSSRPHLSAPAPAVIPQAPAPAPAPQPSQPVQPSKPTQPTQPAPQQKRDDYGHDDSGGGRSGGGGGETGDD